jgi:hypothetical protein
LRRGPSAAIQRFYDGAPNFFVRQCPIKLRLIEPSLPFLRKWMGTGTIKVLPFGEYLPESKFQMTEIKSASGYRLSNAEYFIVLIRLRIAGSL